MLKYNGRRLAETQNLTGRQGASWADCDRSGTRDSTGWDTKADSRVETETQRLAETTETGRDNEDGLVPNTVSGRRTGRLSVFTGSGLVWTVGMVRGTHVSHVSRRRAVWPRAAGYRFVTQSGGRPPHPPPLPLTNRTSPSAAPTDSRRGDVGARGINKHRTRRQAAWYTVFILDVAGNSQLISLGVLLNERAKERHEN